MVMHSSVAPTEPPVKTCNCCKRQYSLDAFLSLAIPPTMAPETEGVRVVDYGDGGPPEREVWRNCKEDCNSTLVLVEVAA